MKIKKIVLLLLLSIIVLTACGELRGVKNLPGQIIIYNSNKEVHGLAVIDFSLGITQNIFKDKGSGSFDYSSERDKIVVFIYKHSPQDIEGIYEYDLKTASLTLLMEASSTADPFAEYYADIRYIPNENAISYKLGGKLYIYDFDKQEESRIIEFTGVYSWNNDGEYFLYDSKSMINKYCIETGQTEELFSGINPELSKSNKYIAYQERNEDGKYILIIKDLSTGEKWFSEKDAVFRGYRFSPDEKYVIFTRSDNSSLASLANSMLLDFYVWDFQKGDVKKIMSGKSGNGCIVWDYINT